MKLVRFFHRGNNRYGILEHNSIRLLKGSPFEGIVTSQTTLSVASVRFLAPVDPTKVVAVGLNYRDHAKELGMPVPKQPILFLKPPSAVIGSNDDIVYPTQSKQLDYEAELAVVIGKKAKDVPVKYAKQYILGLTCANDITARDIQKLDKQWTRAKSFDTFCPLGPCLETEISNNSLDINLKVNGKIKQSSNTNNMIFSVDQLVSCISQVMTLEAGDVILTGTPPGVGSLKVGDEVTVTITGIGSLVNKVVAKAEKLIF